MNRIIFNLVWLGYFTWQNFTWHLPCCSMHQNVFPFYNWVILPCIDTLHCVYPPISWWMFWTVSTFGTLAVMNNAAINIHVQNFCIAICFIFLSYMPGLLCHMVTLMFNHFRNCQPIFKEQLHHFTFPPAKHEGFSFSTSSPILVIISFIFTILVGIK